MQNFSDSEDCIESDLVECFDWIIRCGFQINVDENCPKNELAIKLMREMNDGVLPMNLLKVLSNKKIDPKNFHKYSSRPEDSQFECLTNLKLFNSLVIQYFGIDEIDLVDASDIYNGRNYGKFISLLSKLSQSEFAKLSGIKGFPQRNHIINPGHEFYMHLEEIAVKSDIYTRRRPDDTDRIREPDEEKIYETLVQHRSDAPVTKSKRDMCILEIVESEKNYVESLQVLVQGYKMPLQQHLSSDELNKIFMYIEDMFRVHQMLHSKLTIAVIPNRLVRNDSGAASHTYSNTMSIQNNNNNSNSNLNNTSSNISKLHNVFIETKNEMLIYGRYCINLQCAQNLVQDMIKTNQNKRTQLEKCQEKSGKFKKFPLSDLLTLPMQRILKYHLLFQTLLKYTETNHEDYEGLQLAHEEMISLAAFVNDVKRDQEAIISIDKIQKEMTGIHLPINKKLSDYGRRQKDGELKVQLNGEPKPRQRHVFIFDKMLMLAKRKNDGYDFKHAFYLPDKMPERTDVFSRKQEKGYPFKISVRPDMREIEPVMMFCKSDEMRNQWIEAFSIAITNQYPPGSRLNGFLFEMTTFDTHEFCYFCHKLLSGIFFQGYRCKKTGVVAHKQCIPDAPLPPTSFPSSPSLQYNSNTNNPVTLPPRKNSDNSNNSINMSSSNQNIHQQQLHHQAQQPLIRELSSSSINNHRINNFITTTTPYPARDAFGMQPFVDNSHEQQNSDQPLWYVGEMEREEAARRLSNQVPGTFLIRVSTNIRRAGEFSLSVMDSEPKHMRICRSGARCSGSFYIEQAHMFDSLKDLVEFYSTESLNQFFQLDVPDLKLKYPIRRRINRCVSNDINY